MRIFALLVLVSGCASLPKNQRRMTVEYMRPKDARDELLTCQEDSKRENVLQCVGFGTFLEVMRQRAEAQQEQERKCKDGESCI